MLQNIASLQFERSRVSELIQEMKMKSASPIKVSFMTPQHKNLRFQFAQDLLGRFLFALNCIFTGESTIDLSGPRRAVYRVRGLICDEQKFQPFRRDPQKVMV
jgi:hypothetical protein